MKKIQSLINRLPLKLQQKLIANAVDTTIRQFFPEKFSGLCHVYAIVGSNVLSITLNRNFIPVAGIAIIDAGGGQRLEMLDDMGFRKENGGAYHCWIESADTEETVLIDFTFRHKAAYAVSHGIKWRKKKISYLWGVKKDLHIDLTQQTLPKTFPDEKIWVKKCKNGTDFLEQQISDYLSAYVKLTSFALKRLTLELEEYLEKNKQEQNAVRLDISKMR